MENKRNAVREQTMSGVTFTAAVKEQRAKRTQIVYSDECPDDAAILKAVTS